VQKTTLNLTKAYVFGCLLLLTVGCKRSQEPSETTVPKNDDKVAQTPTEKPAAEPPAVQEAPAETAKAGEETEAQATPEPAQPAVIPAPKDVAAPPKKAKKTKSGLAILVLQKGKGKTKPSAESVVRVHYTGWTTDGKMFDSSVARGEPAEFPLNRVIAGWTEGLQLMVPGEKALLWIPQELAYQGQPGMPAGMLVFEVELLEIK